MADWITNPNDPGTLCLSGTGVRIRHKPNGNLPFQLEQDGRPQKLPYATIGMAKLDGERWAREFAEFYAETYLSTNAQRIPAVQHDNQHIKAITETVRKKDEVSAAFFDDKVREMGRLTVSGGKIQISLNSLPSLITAETTRDFVIESIGLALKACWDAKSDAFDPYRA